MFKAHELINYPAALAVLLTEIEKEYKKYASDELHLVALVNERRASKVASLTVVKKGKKRADDPTLELAIHKIITQPVYQNQYARKGEYIGFAKDVSEVLENEVLLRKMKAEKEAKKKAEKEPSRIEKTDSKHNDTEDQANKPKRTRKPKG
jgi:hypothetical protein